MAKLSAEVADKVAETESTSFEALPEGAYHVRLREVDPTREGNAGPYWNWEFEVVEGEHLNRRLWVTTSLSDASLWKMKETFDAFGADYKSTDTDDLCGQVVKAIVSRRTIQSGARAGEIGNNVDRLKPADDGFEAPEAKEPTEEADIFS